MLRTPLFASVSVVLLAAALAAQPALARKPKAAQEPAPSPLGTFPAQVDYLSNDAPFVVFDVSPRSLDHRTRSRHDAELAFMATEPLSQVTIHTYANPAAGGTREVPMRTVCTAKEAGYHRCAVPLALGLAHLQGGAGWFGMRIEAEGLDGERSVVHVRLPVKGTAGKPATPAAPKEASPPLSLTFVGH